MEIKPSEELGTIHEPPTYSRLEPEPPEDPELQEGSQTFFPSFSPFNNQPLGHSRPFYFQQEGAYSQRAGSFRQNLGFDNQKYDNYQPRQRDSFSAPSDVTHGLLGSGNFGVIKGGTFYNDKDSDATEYAATRHNVYSNAQFYNNGHGRPSFYFGHNPRPYQHEQFANFKDFADINTPSYSHYVLVYVNKNGTDTEVRGPKNIIEQLEQLDEEAPPKKLSKSKRKLALLPPEKKTRTKTKEEKDLYEPLLALS